MVDRPTTRAAAVRTALAIATGAGMCGLAAVPAMANPEQAAEPAGPSNIIVLISDGGGFNQFDIVNQYEQGHGYNQVSVNPSTGAVEHIEGAPVQVYEEWPVQVASSHYSASGRADYITEEAWGDFGWVATGATDSAAAGTALGTGVKTNNGVIGFDPDGDQLLTVGEQALAVDKAVGLVTTVPFNHATPAGFIAHNPDRNDYHGLATEMIDSGVDVLIGAGHPNFTDNNTSRPSHFGAGSWISQEDFERVSSGETPFSYVERTGRFEQIAAGTNVPEQLFGLLPVAETAQYNRSGLANNDVLPFTDPANDVPGLDTLTTAALNVVGQDEDGFFLMVEGGAVDWAGHANQTTRVIEEQIDFNNAVEAATAWVEANSSWDETLIIVTADHETGYLTGPGSGPETGWTPLAGAAGELPEVSWHSGNHTNDLVPFYAQGAGSEQLQARATSWDTVRGAYLDNTDVGEVVFDFLGHATSDTENAVSLQADVTHVVPDGALSLSVTDRGPVRFEGEALNQAASLPDVSVTDTRTETQAQGLGWTVSGTASDWVAGNRTIDASSLGWAPLVVSSDSGASAGAAATLAEPAELAAADRLTRVGTTVLGADLDLTVPSDAEAGNYASEITLTLFAQD